MTLKLLNTFWFSIAALFFIGCSTPAYFGVPNQRFESPTVAGETLKGAVGGGYEYPTYVVTVKDISATPPDSSGTEITRWPSGFDTTFLDSIAFELRLGLGRDFEISNVGSVYHIKYQFLGAPRATPKNEWVAAITADFFSGSRETSVESSDYELTATGLGGSLIAGYRKGPLIYYGNLNLLNFSADTKVTQSGTLAGDYSDDGSQLGFILGLRRESERGFYTSLEWSYSKTSWADLDDVEYGSAGAIFGFNW